jgi:hypothetical protein
MAEVLPPLPGCRRLYLYEMPGDGLVNGRGEPLAVCGAVRVVSLFHRGRCRRLLLSPVAMGGAFAGPAGLQAYAAAYFHLAPDFAGAYLPVAASAGWLARFTLDVPSGLLSFLSARHGKGFP